MKFPPPFTNPLNPVLSLILGIGTNKVPLLPSKTKDNVDLAGHSLLLDQLKDATLLPPKKLVSLSEQNLMDCSTAQGNQGCNGGLMTQAMQYIISNKGIDTESSYPYTAEDGTCSFNAANVGATLSSFTNVNSGDEGDLQAKVYQGPTSVAIDASQSSFQFYSSGVYSDPSCSSTALDHGVLAYGWGTSGSTAYWAVKNSWGTDWGQAGFIWMARNDNNMCGIATMATLPSC